MEGSAPDLLGHFAGFLGRAMSPARFQQWLVEAEAGIESFGTENEVELAWTIENRFYEWAKSGASDEALRSVLREDAVELGFLISPPPVSAHGSSVE